MKILNFKLKIIFLFLLLVTCYLSLVTGSVSAQTNSLPANTDSNVPNNLHNWTQTVMIEVASALSCQLTGIDPTKPEQQCLGVDQATGKIGFLPAGDPKNGQVGGAIGGMSSLISILYTPPAHSGDYFRYLAENFGVTKKTYAQVPAGTTGTGFEGLRPLLNLWTAFRNIVYLIFVLVFVIIGIAIMLRVRIDPRTVMTIQNQIPKILIGILLVTFSYAIAGFLIDIMYLSIHIIGNLIVSTDPTLANLPTQLAEETNTFQAAGHVNRGGGNAALGLISIVFEPTKAITSVVVNVLTDAMQGVVTGLTPGGGGLFGWIDKILELATDVLLTFTGIKTFIGGIIGIVAFLVIAIAVFIALFRLWFTLIVAYVRVLLNVVLAPFWIVGSLVPGSPISATGWLRDTLANLSAFPVVIFMFLLGKMFFEAFKAADEKTKFLPPLIGDRASVDGIGALIGLGIILMTPNVVNMLKAALKAPKVDTGIGRAIAPGLGIPTRAAQTAGGVYVASKFNIMGESGPAAAAGRTGRIIQRFFR